MKRIITLFIVSVATVINAQKISQKVVISNSGEEVGRYIRETSTKYLVDVQDTVWVPKKGNKVVEYSAVKGQGIIYLKNWGVVNVRKTPSTTTAVVGKLIYEEGYVPEAYPCLGYKNGWYKTEVNGKTGWVRADNVIWDSISTF
ncbi:SH3 domain-containing protein [Bergeyella zoohelcum]|uniref:Bacterial SH3 domain n=1 Tax=Bergeyella zoohelcum TaxID=1015 RepID=A0A7Z8YNG4_9FLAO|nr:SH3 domain-containing protein [Bergeyella zoohelcum]VDH02554.1 Bacterial SH3 domain [Bergeyella zoohelcum]